MKGGEKQVQNWRNLPGSPREVMCYIGKPQRLPALAALSVSLGKVTAAAKERASPVRWGSGHGTGYLPPSHHQPSPWHRWVLVLAILGVMGTGMLAGCSTPRKKGPG